MPVRQITLLYLLNKLNKMKKFHTTLLAAILSLSAVAQNIVYVNDDATGNNDGTSWANAYTDLNDALTNTANDATYAGAQIWIAEGFYTRLSQNQSFSVDNDVLLYGGFAGTESSLAARDIENHPTIISGDVDWNDTGAPSSSNSSMSQNAANIFKVLSPNRALFDGLIIERAFSTTEAGGGINVVSSTLENLQISNCIIRENVSMNRAGVLYYAYVNASGLYMFNNRIEDNVNTDTTTSSYTIEFRAASTIWTYSDVHFVNNLFKNNTSESSFQMGTIARFTTFGGSDIDLYLTNNTFVDNPQTGYNYFDSVSALIVYEHAGGGGTLHTFLNNNIFYNNPGATDIFGASLQGSSVTGQLTVYNTSSNQNVQDFTDNLNLQNTHIVTSSPFVDAANGNYTPIAAYRTVGDTTYYDNQYLNNSYPGQEYPTTDLAGNPRFDAQGNFSLGAYQYQVGTGAVDVELSEVKVYPNPMVDVVKIEAAEAISTVTISNYLGQEMMSFHEINSSEFTFGAAHLETGLYYVIITMHNGQKQLKPVIK